MPTQTLLNLNLFALAKKRRLSFVLVSLLVVFCTLLPLSQTWSATTKTRWSRKDQLCTFRRPLYVGASVTAATARRLVFYNAVISGFLGAPYRTMGISPSKKLASYYRTEGLQRKLARHGAHRVPEIGMEKNLSIMYTSRRQHVGSYQTQALLDKDGQHARHYKNASIIMGIDLFYWDSVYGYCGFGRPRFDRVTKRRFDTEHQIRRLIRRAKKDNKPLFLGTVPLDQSDKVFIDSERLGIGGLWYPPEPACVASINQTIRKHCKISNGCYVVDLQGLVDDLYRGKKLTVNGMKHGLHSLRPDGVHLSRAGTQVVFEEMKSLIEVNPPKCRESK